MLTQSSPFGLRNCARKSTPSQAPPISVHLEGARALAADVYRCQSVKSCDPEARSPGGARSAKKRASEWADRRCAKEPTIVRPPHPKVGGRNNCRIRALDGKHTEREAGGRNNWRLRALDGKPYSPR